MAVATGQPFLRLHPQDNIAVAKCSVAAGMEFSLDAGQGAIATRDPIQIGHKVATQDIAAGQPIRKFGQSIGYATSQILAGDWVHTHNVEAGKLSLDYAYATETPPPPTPITGRTFLGYRRADGRAATRNYVGIVSTVNCSAATSKYVAQRFDASVLADFPNVDGVLPLVHKGGCGMQYGGEDHEQLNRVLAGFARHPNIGAYVILGLGCETGQASFLAESHGLVQLQGNGHDEGPRPLIMNIQDYGGVRKTVEHAVAVLREMLPEVNRVERTPIPVSELILGTECGGSDGNSGVTSNPALGIASDMLVAAGGTAILSETSEIYGGEHLLTRRAKTREIGEKLIERIRWWERYTAMFGVDIDNNPSIGNKRGGLTTIYEKSLGAIAKGGSTALCEVYKYAEPVRQKGFVIMDTPGYDAASVTGMVAGGANIVAFTTGRGSCFGIKPVPTLKIASNTPMYDRMVEDMDVNAGRILEGSSVEEVGSVIFEKLIAVASGEHTKSEAQGIGEEEFCPWSIGPVL